LILSIVVALQPHPTTYSTASLQTKTAF